MEKALRLLSAISFGIERIMPIHVRYNLIGAETDIIKTSWEKGCACF